MDKELIVMVALGALVFLFILPPWSDMGTNLSVDASLADNEVTFTAEYTTSWQKSSYLVVYGPFVHDLVGHEFGNNIYVLSDRQGSFTDTLILQEGQTLESLKIEMWNDHEKLEEVEVPL